MSFFRKTAFIIPIFFLLFLTGCETPGQSECFPSKKYFPSPKKDLQPSDLTGNYTSLKEDYGYIGSRKSENNMEIILNVDMTFIWKNATETVEFKPHPDRESPIKRIPEVVMGSDISGTWSITTEEDNNEDGLDEFSISLKFKFPEEDELQDWIHYENVDGIGEVKYAVSEIDSEYHLIYPDPIRSCVSMIMLKKFEEKSS